MKKKTAVLLLCMATGIAVISFADVTPGEKPSAGNENSQLRAELDQLKAKVEMLELRTKSLESTVAQLKQPPHPSPLTVPQENLMWRDTPAATTQSVPVSPKIWGEKEVNGWTFYIVPCEQRNQ